MAAPVPGSAQPAIRVSLVPEDEQSTVRTQSLDQRRYELGEEAIAGADAAMVGVLAKVGGDPGEVGEVSHLQVGREIGKRNDVRAGGRAPSYRSRIHERVQCLDVAGRPRAQIAAARNPADV